MSPELLYLFLTTVLLTFLWIPHIIGQVVTRGSLKPEEYRVLRDMNTAEEWVKRANRAHVNLVEQFGAFAGLVLVAHLVNVSNSVTVACAAVFFWCRIVHAIVMIAGLSIIMIRTLVFTIAFFALVVYAWQIAANTIF